MKHRSDVITPLTKFFSEQTTWNWTEEHQKTFEHMKESISRETILVYPNFCKPSVIQTDASKVQHGAIISKENRQIGFYCGKLNPAQVNHTTTERVLLSFVETLKNLRKNILLLESHNNLKTSGVKNTFFI